MAYRWLDSGTFALACTAIFACEAAQAGKAAPVPAAPAEPVGAPVRVTPPVDAPIDWTAAAIEIVVVEVDGQRVRLSVPEGLRLERKLGDGTFGGYASWVSPTSFEAPSFTVQEITAPADLAAAVAAAEHLGRYRASFAAAHGDGYLVAVTEPRGKYLRVEALARSPSDRWYRLAVTQRTRAPMADLERRQAWMLELATALTLE